MMYFSLKLSAIDDAINQIVEPGGDDVKNSSNVIVGNEVDGIVSAIGELDLETSKEHGDVDDDTNTIKESSQESVSDKEITTITTTLPEDVKIKDSDLVIEKFETHDGDCNSDVVEQVISVESTETGETGVPVYDGNTGTRVKEVNLDTEIDNTESIEDNAEQVRSDDVETEVKGEGSDNITAHPENTDNGETDDATTTHLGRANDAISTSDNNRGKTTDSSDSTEKQQHKGEEDKDRQQLIEEEEGLDQQNIKKDKDRKKEVKVEDVEPIHYEFIKENLRPRYKPPLYCHECNQDGHVSKKCPLANFHVDPLPPMEKGFAKRMSVACESVIQDMSLQTFEFDMRIRVLEKLEACLKLHYKSKFFV